MLFISFTILHILKYPTFSRPNNFLFSAFFLKPHNIRSKESNQPGKEIKLAPEESSSNIYLLKHFNDQGLEIKIEGNFTFRQCYFDSCNSIALGGAIFILAGSARGTLSISRCYFDHCTSQMHGGAIYSRTSSFSLSSSCFYACSSKINQAFTLRAETINSTQVNVINFTSIYKSSKNFGQTTAASSALNSFITHINSSHNSIRDQSSGFQASSYMFLGFQYSQIFDTSGSSCLTFHFHSNYTSIYKCNVINNTALLSWHSLISCSMNHVHGIIFIGNFIFSGNSLPLVSSSIDSILVMWNCSFDESEIESSIFQGSISAAHCSFDVEQLSTNPYSILPIEICENPLNLHIDLPTYSIWKPILLFIIVVAIVLFAYFKLYRKSHHRKHAYSRKNRSRLL